MPVPATQSEWQSASTHSAYSDPIVTCHRLSMGCHWSSVHYSALKCTVVHYNALQWSTVQCTWPTQQCSVGQVQSCVVWQVETGACYTTLHYTTLQQPATLPSYEWSHYTALHTTALHWIVLHCTVLYCTALKYTVLYCSALPCVCLFWTALNCNVLHCNKLHCFGVNWSGPHCAALHCTYLYISVMFFFCRTVLNCPVISLAPCNVHPEQCPYIKQ